MTAHDEHAGHEGHSDAQYYAGHEDHSGHQDHTGHELMFRNRFWVCLLLSVPVLIYSPAIQNWFGYAAPVFPGSQWILPVAGYGCLHLWRPTVSEFGPLGVKGSQARHDDLDFPGHQGHLLDSMAALVWDLGEDFFWELVTLIDIMLLGHWMEMRSVRQASGALDALAEAYAGYGRGHHARWQRDGTRAIMCLEDGDLVLLRPGAVAPAHALVVLRPSVMNESMLTGESRPVKKTQDRQSLPAR